MSTKLCTHLRQSTPTYGVSQVYTYTTQKSTRSIDAHNKNSNEVSKHDLHQQQIPLKRQQKNNNVKTLPKNAEKITLKYCIAK